METRHIIARVIAEHSGKSMEEVLAKTANDCYFRAEEAVKFGLADHMPLPAGPTRRSLLLIPVTQVSLLTKTSFAKIRLDLTLLYILFPSWGWRPPWRPCSSSQGRSATCCPTAAS